MEPDAHPPDETPPRPASAGYIQLAPRPAAPSDDPATAGPASQEDRAFRRALACAVFFHAAVLAFIIFAGTADSSFRTLAVYEYDVYDPLGGEPGGGLDSLAEEAAQQLPEPVEEIPEPEPEEPEPDPEPVSFVESTSQKAEEIAPPPPPEPKAEPKPKPKPKPQPKPQAAPQAQSGGPPATAGMAGGTPGRPGGGPGSGQGGVGGGTGMGTRDAREAYKSKVRRKLERNKKYPPRAMTDHIEGIATVRFTINRSGQVVSCSLVKASGHSILDDEVQALLRRVNPFPEFPPELTDPTITLTAPIQFKIR
jgi:protein TonB